mmetsp:Transcript_70820/g.126089  ORF Transcript_70820/g.126089 Transcript_70820/m.126089 type:complete len:139 (+) Transcript_70820:188-604(+)
MESEARFLIRTTMAVGLGTAISIRTLDVKGVSPQLRARGTRVDGTPSLDEAALLRILREVARSIVASSLEVIKLWRKALLAFHRVAMGKFLAADRLVCCRTPPTVTLSDFSIPFVNEILRAFVEMAGSPRDAAKVVID